MTGRGDRARIAQLEDQVIRLRVMARRLWGALTLRSGLEAEALSVGVGDEMRVADRVYDAAETAWERQRISIVPCRFILDPGGAGSAFHSWPVQGDMYIGRWPDGTSRNLTRDQVLMMGGQDPNGDDA